MASTIIDYPARLNGLITNPGMGVEDFQGNILPEYQYPVAGSDYYRFYWNELEPTEGDYNFSLIDKIIRNARQTQPPQNIGLRFMTMADPSDGSQIPQWLIDKGIKGTWVNKTFVPDLNDPLYLSYVRKLLMAFGHHYDGNPYIGSMDIGMVGSWGEWHNSNYPELKSLQQTYSPATLEKYINLYFKAFPHTPKIMLINDGNMMGYATSKGAGWRADCWGDWGVFSSDWSHMKNAYPESIAQASKVNPKFLQSWQKAPVSLEACYTMENWLDKQHYTRDQVQSSLMWAINHHASVLNLKSSLIPPEYRDLLNHALLKLGYRLRLTEVMYPSSVESGSTFVWNTTWANEGDAPPYHDYLLSYRLVNSEGRVATQWQVISNDVRDWLPGTYKFNRSFTLPLLPADNYQWQVAFLGGDNKPVLNLAMAGKQPDGWYNLGYIQITN
jgi:hypothetical protein